MKIYSRIMSFALVTAATASFAQDNTWRKVLDCDNGAAVVDVSNFQNNSVQVVIHNRAIVDYLMAARSPGENNYDKFFIQGLSDRSVYTGGDFHGVRVDDPFGGGPISAAYRDGSGLKVIVWGTVDPRDGNSDCYNGYANCGQPYRVEAANWYFRDCR